ncbi:hypothetical protein [Streptomyces sp. DW26H14]|uniref:hypothetical protein n=1 Tax=Streptomyces sp. DW26H14 TaxID=3435395 RepID=UPI00403D6F7B
MSAYHYLFVRPRPRTDGELVGDISDACGEPLAPVEGAGTIDYAATAGRTAVELELTHEYEEDFGIPFETFDSLVVIRDFDRDQARQERMAREIFAGLSNLNKYALVLVFDLQTEIEAFTPSAPAPPEA